MPDLKPENLTWSQVLTRFAAILALVLSLLAGYDRVYNAGDEDRAMKATIEQMDTSTQIQIAGLTALTGSLKADTGMLTANDAEQRIWIRNHDQNATVRRGEVEGNFGQLQTAIAAMTTAITELTSNAKQTEYRLNKVEITADKRDETIDDLKTALQNYTSTQLLMQAQLGRIENAVSDERAAPSRANPDGSIAR